MDTFIGRRACACDVIINIYIYVYADTEKGKKVANVISSRYNCRGARYENNHAPRYENGNIIVFITKAKWNGGRVAYDNFRFAFSPPRSATEETGEEGGGRVPRASERLWCYRVARMARAHLFAGNNSAITVRGITEINIGAF